MDRPSAFSMPAALQLGVCALWRVPAHEGSCASMAETWIASARLLLARRPRQASFRTAVMLLGLAALAACGGEEPTSTARTAERIAAARAAASRVRAMLEDYYGGPTVLLDTWWVSPEAPEQAAARRFLAEKMARSVVWGAPFVIGAVGSSVTAGTDNCAYDTYPAQLERLLAPVFEAAGARLEVRNAGQGGFCGDSHRNQIWCLRSLVGDDVDVLHYSWTYFEASNPDSPVYHEMFYRWALAMDHAPAPQLLYTGSCERLADGDRQLVDRYAEFGVNVLCMTRGIERAGYPGKQGGVVGDGLHDTTRYGESLPEERRRSLGVVFRNWHPGPLLFQTTADALAYAYLDAFLLALDEVEMASQPARRWPRTPPGLAPGALPEPLLCDPTVCGSETPPRCAYYEEPRFGVAQVRLEGEALDPASREPLPPAPGWRFERRPNGQSMPDAERALPECALPLYCAGYRPEPGVAADWLRFRLPRLERGRIAVCCGSKRCGERLIAAGAEFRLNGKPIVASGTHEKCVVVQERFPGAAERERPEHTLELRLPALNDPPPPITHVFGL